MKQLLLCLVCLFQLTTGGYGQTEKKLIKNGAANTDSFTFNQRDEHGKPTGLWYRLHPEQRGEEAFWEFGYYKAGIRNGAWYKLTKDGEIMAIENYRNSVLSGEAKYYDRGRLTTIGHYRGFSNTSKLDTIVVVDPITQEETLVAVENEKGFTKHGSWIYFDPATGRQIKEEEWQVDELIFQKKFDLTMADSAKVQYKQKSLPHNKNKGRAIHTSGRSLTEGN